MILCALISKKKNGMKGNIIVESFQNIISRFNFESNFDFLIDQY